MSLYVELYLFFKNNLQILHQNPVEKDISAKMVSILFNKSAHQDTYSLIP